MALPVQLRDKFVHYFENPQDYMDFANMRKWEDNAYIVNKQPLNEVLGIEWLGAGYFSNVYALDDRRAFKVVKDADSSYASFIDFVKKDGRGYSCFPKIFYSGVWAGKQVYIIERMANNTDDNRQDRVFLVDYCRKKANNEQFKPSRFFTIPDEFRDGVEALIRYFRNSNGDLTLDIHADNIMFRPNGEPVITDPFS